MYQAPDAPRGLADLIEDAVVLCVAGFRRWWPVALLFAIVMSALSTWMFLRIIDVAAGAPDPAAAIRSMRGSPLRIVVQLVMTAAGIVTSLALAAILLDVSRGGSGSGSESPWFAAWRSLPAALLALLLMMIACCVGFVLLVVPGIYVSVRLTLWTVALMDERSSAVAALRTSWRLIGGHWWRTFGVVVLVGVGLAIALLILNVLVRWSVPSQSTDPGTSLTMMLATQALMQFVGLPLMTSALVVIYRDLRLRAASAPVAHDAR